MLVKISLHKLISSGKPTLIMALQEIIMFGFENVHTFILSTIFVPPIHLVSINVSANLRICCIQRKNTL